MDLSRNYVSLKAPYTYHKFKYIF